MKALIIGSGAVGGLIGARLIEWGEDVTFLVRPSRQVQIMTSGLCLMSPYGRFRRPVHVVTIEAAQTKFDLVISAVRAHEFDEVLARVSQVFDQNAILLPVIEGVRHPEPLRYLNETIVVPSIVEGRLTMDGDGMIYQRSPAAEWQIDCRGALRFSCSEDMVKSLAARGLRVMPSLAVVARSWERFVYLVAGIGASVVMRRPLRDALKFPYGMGAFKGMLKEGLLIGQAAGFNPDRIRSDAGVYFQEVVHTVR